MTYQKALDILFDKFCLTNEQKIKYNHLVMVGDQPFEEAEGAIFKFDLCELQRRCSNGVNEDHFNNKHRAAADRVVGSFGSNYGPNSRYPQVYRDVYVAQFPKIIPMLFGDIGSRQAIMHFHDHTSAVQPCLTSVQFLIRGNKLNTIACFRSWELQEWAIYDLELLRRLTWQVYYELRDVMEWSVEELDIGTLTVFAASAHVAAK